MDTVGWLTIGLLLIWIGYDFIFRKEMMMRWADIRNFRKPRPRTPRRDLRANVVGIVLIAIGLAVIVWAIR